MPTNPPFKTVIPVANNNGTSQSIVIGVYVIIFGAFVGLLEFQVPPQVSRYASFMFSFIGRGICTCHPLRLCPLFLGGGGGGFLRHAHISFPLTSRSLHLHRLHPALAALDTIRGRLHHRVNGRCVCRAGIRALHRAARQHARGRTGLGCRAGLDLCSRPKTGPGSAPPALRFLSVFRKKQS